MGRQLFPHLLNNVGDSLTTAIGSAGIVVVEQSSYVGVLMTASFSDRDSGLNQGLPVVSSTNSTQNYLIDSVNSNNNNNRCSSKPEWHITSFNTAIPILTTVPPQLTLAWYLVMYSHLSPG